MTTTTTTDWTMEADLNAGYCTIRKYTTKTEYRGDEAMHKGTEQTGWQRISLDDLPAFMRERKIERFSNDEDMRLICDMPVED
jgi:hypothetical protein